MDTKKVCMIPECGNLAKITDFKMVVGAKQLRKALENGVTKFVCLAKNADPAITEPLADACREQKIPVSWVRSMKELGQACAIAVGTAAAAVLAK